MSTIEVNGTSLYYEDTGQGRPLLFIHGMCGHANVWSAQVRRLSSHFRCVAYDRRGHTRSPFVSDNGSGHAPARTVELHADDAAGLIDALGLAPCVLVGSSGGARVALDVVRRYPSLLAGAVLSEPPLFALDPDGATTFVGVLRPKIERALTEGPRSAVDAFFDFVCPGLWAGLAEPAKDVYRANHVELFGDLQMPTYAVTEQDLSRVHVPCLVFAGSESLPVLRGIAHRLAAALPDARLVELAGSGHVTYFERPDEFAAAAEAFAISCAGGFPSLGAEVSKGSIR